MYAVVVVYLTENKETTKQSVSSGIMWTYRAEYLILRYNSLLSRPTNAQHILTIFYKFNFFLNIVIFTTLKILFIYILCIRWSG